MAGLIAAIGIPDAARAAGRAAQVPQPCGPGGPGLECVPANGAGGLLAAGDPSVSLDRGRRDIPGAAAGADARA